jgi:hypothetical protein
VGAIGRDERAAAQGAGTCGLYVRAVSLTHSQSLAVLAQQANLCCPYPPHSSVRSGTHRLPATCTSKRCDHAATLCGPGWQFGLMMRPFASDGRSQQVLLAQATTIQYINLQYQQVVKHAMWTFECEVRPTS